MAKTLFLIDGHSLIHRAYWALPPLTTSQGEPTNAVYGFLMMLNRLKEEYNPDEIFVVFDVAAPTFRHEQYADYKATRKPMPDDLRPQVGTLKEVLDAQGIKRLELEGYEADDIIGTAAKQGEKQGFDVFIVTGDRDALQLISDKIKVILTKRGIKDTEVVDRKALLEKHNLTPEQVIELKGLMGDSSDNIPGVPGVGEKTAKKLLEEYSTIENLYENIEQQKGKLKERLIEHKELAFKSKELATIDCKVPISINFEEERQVDQEKLFKLYQRLEFKTLIETQLSLDLKTEPVVNHTEPQEVAIKDLNKDGKDEFLAGIKKVATIAIDLTDNEELLVAFDNEVWKVGKVRTDNVVGQLIQELVEIRDLKITAIDSKLIYLAFYEIIEDLRIDFDLSLAGYVLDPTGSYDVDTLSKKYTNLPAFDSQAESLTRNARQLLRTLELVPVLEKLIDQDELSELYYKIELPLAKVLAKMEHRGILLDTERLNMMSKDMEEKLSVLTEDIYLFAGEEFNINSPKQLGTILFEKLGLPVIKRTKTGPSTDAEVLDQLSDYPIVAKLLEYRQLAKLKSTYVDALPELISKKTNRIHTTFNQTVTATGRLSSTNPNLQNIPIRTAEGRKIREAFIPEEGFMIMSADYSQIELRVLAHISQDEKMITAFNSGIDIHTQTASEVFEIPLQKVTPDERNAAKAINFGIIYGISSFGLAKGTNLSRAQAQEYIDGYFNRYPKVKQYLDDVVKRAKEKGYVTTLMNRRRYLPEISSRNFARRNFAIRTAMNTPIQGSAADIIKMAMIDVERTLVERTYKSRLLLQVHDELVLEVHESELEEVALLVKEKMEQVMKLSVTLEVDVKIGPNWKDVQPYSSN